MDCRDSWVAGCFGTITLFKRTGAVIVHILGHRGGSKSESGSAVVSQPGGCSIRRRRPISGA